MGLNSRVLLAAALFACASSWGPADAVELFEGKTINLTVGYSAGGGYDVYSRLLARHIPQYIPGKPNAVVQNMPGAGSAKAASYIYSAAPRDGTAIGSVAPGVIIAPLLDPKSDLRYDPTRFIYIGTADSGTRVCATLKRSNIASFEQAQRRKTIIGGVAPGSSTVRTPAMASPIASRDNNMAPSNEASASRLWGGTRPIEPEPAERSLTTPPSYGSRRLSRGRRGEGVRDRSGIGRTPLSIVPVGY